MRGVVTWIMVLLVIGNLVVLIGLLIHYVREQAWSTRRQAAVRDRG